MQQPFCHVQEGGGGEATMLYRSRIRRLVSGDASDVERQQLALWHFKRSHAPSAGLSLPPSRTSKFGWADGDPFRMQRTSPADGAAGMPAETAVPSG